MKPYVKSRRKGSKLYSRGEKVHEILMLRAEQTTLEWVDRVEYQQRILRKKAVRKAGQSKSPLKNNTLVKTSTDGLYDVSPNANTMNAPSNFFFTEDYKTQAILTDTSTSGNENEGNVTIQDDERKLEPKSMHNHTIDAFSMVETRKGFLNAKVHSTLSTNTQNQIMGVYCIHWRRTGTLHENETKLIVNCVETVEAPLNIYCYIDEKMYVKVPMTLLITLKNTTNSTLHLKSLLKNADNFMFAGHSQVC